MKEILRKNEYQNAMREAAKIKIRPFQFRNTYPAYIVLIITIALSIFIYILVDKSITQSRLNQFDKSTTSVITRLEQGYQLNLQVLNSVRGLYDNMIQVVRDYFMLYTVVPLKSYPSITSMMSVQRIRSENLIFFRHYVQSQGYLTYDIFPQDKFKKEYYPIEFIFPDTTSKHLHGLDVNDVNELSHEIIRAHDTKGLVATNAFILRKPDTLSIFLVSPVFKSTPPTYPYDNPKDSLDKLIILEMDAYKYVHSSLGRGITSDTSIIFNCYQETDNKKVGIFKSDNYSLLSSGYKPYFNEIKKIRIGNKNLMVHFSTIPNFGGQFQKYLPILSLIISLIVSITIFGFVLSVTVTRTRAVDLAERLTRSQRRIMESTSDIIASITFDGVWKSMNAASVKILGYLPDDLLGKNIKELFVNEKDFHIFQSMKPQTDTEQIHRHDFLMKDSKNENKWLNWDFTLSGPDNIIYCVGRDVTLEKLAEYENSIKVKQVQLAEQLKTEASEFKSLFLTNLSYRLRNSLTTILGYQQLIKNESYDSKEELESYIGTSFEMTQDLFTNITDMVDVAEGSDSGKMEIERIDISNILNNSIKLVLEDEPDKEIIPEISEQSDQGILFADRTSLTKALCLILKVVTLNKDKCKIFLTSSPNPYEKNTELVFQSDPNEMVSEMIGIFKNQKSDIISSLKDDKFDILLNLALSTSILRTMGGSMSVDTLGRNERNIVILTIPFLSETS